MRFPTLFFTLFTAACVAPPPAPPPPPMPRAVGCEGCTVFTHGLVFDGSAIAPATLVIEGDRVKEVVSGEIVVTAGVEVSLQGKTVMPGLIDSHVHLLAASGPYGFFAATDHTKDHLKAFLRAGVTSFVDVGGSKRVLFEYRERLRDGRLLGPRMFAAGPLFTAPGGHPCLTGSPPGDACELIASPGDVAPALGRLLPDSPDLLKVIFEHGTEGRPLPTLDRDSAAAIWAGATDAGVQVIAHVSQDAELALALELGIRRFAHLPGVDALTRATAELAVAKQAFIVPTLSIYDALYRISLGEFDAADPALRDEVPAEVLTALRSPALLANIQTPAFQELYATWRANAVEGFKVALAAGVRIAAGTDCGNPAAFHGPTLRRELSLYVEAGMSPLAALQAGTRNVAELIGHPDLGRLTPGAMADLLVVVGDPSADVSALAAIDSVWLGGKRLDRDALKVGGTFELEQRPTTAVPDGATCLAPRECGPQLYCEFASRCAQTCTSTAACGPMQACLPQLGSFTEGYCQKSDGCDVLAQDCRNGEACQWLGNSATLCHFLGLSSHGQRCGRFGECARGHQCDFNSGLCLKLCDPAAADAGCPNGGACDDVSAEAGLAVGHCSR